MTILHRELRTNEVANPRPDTVFPSMEFLQPGVRLFGQRRTAPAKAVQFLQLTKKLDGIIDAINTEFELLDLVAVNRDFRLLAWHVGLLAAEREVSFAGVVLGQGVMRKDQREAVESKRENEPCAAHHSSPRRMFQR